MGAERVHGEFQEKKIIGRRLIFRNVGRSDARCLSHIPSHFLFSKGNRKQGYQGRVGLMDQELEAQKEEKEPPRKAENHTGLFCLPPFCYALFRG